MQKCAIIGFRKELTITEYSLTTSTKVNYKIQKERTLHLVLRPCGETEHDTNDNVTINTQNTFNTAHMNLFVSQVLVVMIHIALHGSRVLRMSSHPRM